MNRYFIDPCEKCYAHHWMKSIGSLSYPLLQPAAPIIGAGAQ
jgi:hypothetical protein